MYAIVDIAGKQYKVCKNDHIQVPKLAGDVGASVEFDRVLLLSNKGKITVGQPIVKGASVKAKILGFDRDKKVIVFKKKRRKGYQVKRGHRQDYTSLLIQGISSK
ncbi:MAG: 50S ribosomal protein L21 [bacterium]